MPIPGKGIKPFIGFLVVFPLRLIISGHLLNRQRRRRQRSANAKWPVTAAKDK